MLRHKRLIFALALLSARVSQVAVAEVAIIAEAGPLSVSAAGYEARIEGDGCLTSLRVGGREFLAPGVTISRGSYFFQGSPLKLEKVERISDKVVFVESDAASIRYEFNDQDIHWRLTNKSDEPMVFFFVFAKDVDHVIDENHVVRSVPINIACKDAILISGNAKLQLRGCDKLWGPWQGPHQICEVTLKPKESRDLWLEVGELSVEERALIQALAPVVTEPKFQLFSPRTYQVFQRSGASSGTILISGHTTTDADSIRVRITGKSLEGLLSGEWQTLPLIRSTQSFAAELTIPAGGWYKLAVEARREGRVLAESQVEAFGVGEVFIGAGQSNSTNYGEIRTKSSSGMVASFSGENWQLANDPQPGVADESQGGSFWPAFGDAMHERFGVPIGVAATGYGGTSVNQWQPDGDLFPWMMMRVQQLGPLGFRALLWHQGESDIEMPSDAYYAKLRNVIQASRAQARWYVPWFVAQATYHNPEKLQFEPIRQAQAKLWQDGIALEGPDTDTLTGDTRDLGGLGIHLSPKGLRLHGLMWADCVGDFVDGVLGRPGPARINVKAEAWPEADAMFRRDPNWFGGDDAYSIDLGDGRVAWFFGDSFVAPTVAGQRKGTTMVHNSVGIQTGYDPTQADFKTYWRQTAGQPTSFVPDEGDEYFWPGGSIMVDSKLLMFLMRVRSSEGGLGFETTGWGAVLIDNLEASPDQWKISKLTAPQNDFRVLVGSASVMRDGEYLVAFSVSADKHDVFLVRWSLAAAAAGELAQPEWWTGNERGWVDQRKLESLPTPLLKRGQTEFSVLFSRKFDRYLQFQFEGFPISPIGMRTSASLTGPWSTFVPCFRPDEMQLADPGLMLYAAKAHPEQSTDGLALTYASNTRDMSQLFEIPNIYYPRFFRVTLSRSTE